MAQDEKLEPIEYLDRFFDTLREEARSNPAFAARLVKALGGEVVFEDSQKADVANPFVIVAEADRSRFYATYASMKIAQIKRVLRDNNLATAVDIRGKSASQLIDMLYDRASSKVMERRTSAH